MIASESTEATATEGGDAAAAASEASSESVAETVAEAAPAQAEGTSKIGRPAQELEAARILADVAHEGAIDLDDVDREGIEIAEARITGAEIVDGNGNAEATQLAQDRLHLEGLVHQAAFSHFQMQP